MVHEMICMSDPGSQHTPLFTGHIGLANNEILFYNVANNVNIQEYCKVQEYNVTATHYNIKQALKIIRKPCGNKKKATNARWKHKQKTLYLSCDYN